VAEFENSVFTASALGARRERPRSSVRRRRRLPKRQASASRSGSDGSSPPAALLEGAWRSGCWCRPSSGAAGLGARAGTAPTCHFTTSNVSEGLVSLATLARRMLPVKAVVDGAVGEEGVVVVAPAG